MHNTIADIKLMALEQRKFTKSGFSPINMEVDGE